VVLDIAGSDFDERHHEAIYDTRARS